MIVDEMNQDPAFKLDAMMRRRRDADLRNEGREDATTNLTRALYSSGMKEEEIAFRLNMPLTHIHRMIWHPTVTL